MISSTTVNKYPSNIGIVLCGHGSRDPQAVEEFINVVNKIKSRIPSIPVAFGFLEFNRPIIREALDQLKNMGVKRVIALPAMLFAAGHTKNDIPSVLNKYSVENGLTIQYGRELGLNSLMIGAAGARLTEIIDSNPTFPISETLLVVAGRGSSDPDANSNVCKITRMLVEGFGFGWGETVFSGVTFPLVEPGLNHVVKLGYKNIILFPYFLFTGILVKRIYDYTDLVAARHPNVEFIKAGYLNAMWALVFTSMILHAYSIGPDQEHPVYSQAIKFNETVEGAPVRFLHIKERHDELNEEFVFFSMRIIHSITADGLKDFLTDPNYPKDQPKYIMVLDNEEASSVLRKAGLTEVLVFNQDYHEESPMLTHLWKYSGK